MSGRDIWARAKNKNGKIGAYCTLRLEQIVTTKDIIQGMIIVSTRELALQTSQIAIEVPEHLGIKIVVATDDTNLKDDIMRIYKKVHLGVATSGRIIALREKRVANGSKYRTRVLEEGDKLLSQDIKGGLERVTSRPPTNRQSLLYSATFPLTAETFEKKHKKDPYEINLMNEYAIGQERQKGHCLNHPKRGA